MDIFMARQPIYDITKQVHAYELLYRQDKKNAVSEDDSEGEAVQSLVPNVIESFGIGNITGGNHAFIQFDKELILEDFPRAFDRDTVVVEVLRDIAADKEAMRKVSELSTRGYTIALKDYVEDERLDAIMKYINIIKIDFSCADENVITLVSEKFKGKKELLAAKISTEEQFAKAVRHGFEFFQGAYFTKPRIKQGKNLSLRATSYSEMISEMGKLSPDFISLSQTIRSNATLTFKLLQHANTMKFIQKERVSSIHMALVNMGMNEVRRWVLLMLAQEFGNDKQTELVKMSFIRAIFLERLAFRSSIEDRINEVFLMGVLSMLDAIAGMSIDVLVEEIPIAEDIKSALKGETVNPFSELLNFVKAYEGGYWDEIENNIEKYNFDRDSISKIYLECVINAELVFNNKTMATQ